MTVITEKPALHWGIIGTGLISSWFVADLCVERLNTKAHHTIQAIGSSSKEKGTAFARKHLPENHPPPTVYGNYEDLYRDPDVDIVYIGTPHAFHKQNCLGAIRGGKHVLCEKAFTLNAKEAEEVFAEAEKQGVFVMEAMWTRFFPLVRKIQSLIHDEKAIGEVHRVFCDFAMPMNISDLPPTSRLKSLDLGAGSLLDIGIYSLTWALLALENPSDGAGDELQQEPQIFASQRLSDGVDIATSVMLSYPDGKQGIVTSSTMVKTPPTFCRIEGSKGTILVEGFTSAPAAFSVMLQGDGETYRHEFERPGRGFYWEADAVAQDIAAGRKENGIMPWKETLRVLRLMDEIRRQGGAKFPQDSA